MSFIRISAFKGNKTFKIQILFHYFSLNLNETLKSLFASLKQFAPKLPFGRMAKKSKR